uniref:Uncharacterized protein n=1 Tax=Anguilla anguilla TaxID=7936 RepID=A0A0E9U907_ANGAN
MNEKNEYTEPIHSDDTQF